MEGKEEKEKREKKRKKREENGKIIIIKDYRLELINLEMLVDVLHRKIIMEELL